MYTKVTKVTDIKAKIFINYFVSVCAKCEVKHYYTEVGTAETSSGRN
jgi:hypothetical protein